MKQPLWILILGYIIIVLAVAIPVYIIANS